MKDLSLVLIFSFTLFCMTGCTYTITMAHTEGQATDLIDETSTNTPNVSPTVNVPASAF